MALVLDVEGGAAMPPGPIVDSHVHLWDPTRFRMPWLDGNERIGKPFGLAEFREHSAGIEVEGIVYLQVEVTPPYALLEAQWVADQPADGPPILGIVPWAPLEDGDRARSFLDAMVAIDPRIKGIRRLYQSEPDLDFCIRPDFIRGVQILPEYGLSFDLGVFNQHLKNTITLVRACPEVSFVLDHIGKPDIKGGMREPWYDEIRQLAVVPERRLQGQRHGHRSRPGRLDHRRPPAVRRARAGVVRRGPGDVRRRLAGRPDGLAVPPLGGGARRDHGRAVRHGEAEALERERPPVLPPVGPRHQS